MTLLWQGQQLRKSLAALETAYHVDIWLDRRLDPDQTFDLEINDQPLSEVLQGIVERCDAGYQAYGDMIYVGPTQTASELATLMAKAREQLNDCPARVRRRWVELSSLRWNAPTEPRKLLERLADQCGAHLVHSELVPHDLWRAGAAPNLRNYELANPLAGEFRSPVPSKSKVRRSRRSKTNKTHRRRATL